MLSRMMVAAASALSVIAGEASAATMIVANNGTNDVYAVDISSQTATLLGNAGISLNFGGLGFAQNGTLYGWATSFFTNSLYTVDTGNGQWNLVGAGAAPCGDTFDINPGTNEAILFDVCSDNVYDVNLGDGSTTLRVSASGDLHFASAFSPSGILYQVDPGGSQISTVNIDTGQVTVVGATGISTPLTNLSYNPEDDMLYAVGLSNSRLYRLDPVLGTGVDLGPITNLPTGGQWTMSTIDAVLAPADIPTVSEWGLIVLALLMLTAGTIIIRREMVLRAA